MSFASGPNRDPRSLSPPVGKPSRAGRPRGRRWWCWIIRAFLALLVGAGLLAIYYAYRRHEAVAAVRAAVLELDRTEPGWRLHELDAARAVVPEDQNSAPVMIEAYRLLPPDWQPEKSLERIKSAPPNMRLDDQDAADLHEELAKLQPALQETRKIATLPNGRYPSTYLHNLGALKLDDVQHSRKLMALLQYDALVQAQDGDAKGALRSCLAQLNAARSIGDEPLMISQLVRIAGVGIACKSTERVLNQGEPPSEELLALQRLLEEEERFPRLLISLRGERAYMHEIAEAIEAGDIRLRDHVEGPPSRWDWFGEIVAMDIFRAARPTLLALHTEGVKIGSLPAHERVQPMQALETKWRSQPGIARGLYPGTAIWDNAARRTDAQLRCLMTALAIERYRRQHDRLPDKLAQLVPELLAAIPIDPLDGEPLGYQRLDDRVVVYSRCPIRKVDSGDEVYDPDEPSPPGVGIAVHLYDVKHRRQPFAELLPSPGIDDDPQ